MTSAKRILSVLLMLVMAATLCACSGSTDSSTFDIQSWDDLSGRTIAVKTGSIADDLIINADGIPNDLNFIYTKSDTDSAIAVMNGKADAVVLDKPVAELLCNTYPELCIYKDVIAPDNYGFLLQKGSSLTDPVNDAISALREDGTMDALLEKWFAPENDGQYIAAPDWPGSNGVLRVALGSSTMPMSYIRNGEPAGFETELIYRVAKELDMLVQIEVADFDAILAGVTSGKYDIGASCFSITEERKQIADMTDTVYEGAAVLVYKKSASELSEVSLRLEDYENASFGVWAGSIYETALLERFPESNIVNYNSLSEMAQCVQDGKLDAFCASDGFLGAILRQNDRIQLLPEAVTDFDACFIVRKGRDDGLLQEFNAFVAELKESGELDKLKDIWMTGGSEPIETEFSGENGELVIAMDSLNEPYFYVKDGEYAGYDLDIAARFCKARGYTLVLEAAPFNMLIPGLDSGQYDMAAGSVEPTAERRETADFSDPTYTGQILLAVRNDASSEASFIDSIRFSFERTFLRENRWQLFLSGILTTLWIAVISMVLGTVLGFLTYFICKGGNRLANKIAGFCIWLVEGMPMVVLLMILYYIVFGKSDISGIWVSIIGFTLTFGCSMFGMVKSGVDAVDLGQMEAALAMGYGGNQAFCRMILPQAARHIISPYKSAMVQHIKATSIVGYIAVQDLTKMSDIIRSRTYEAFFPLIATAVFYFIITAILTSVIKRLQISLDPRKKDSRLLKEVKQK